MRFIFFGVRQCFFRERKDDRRVLFRSDIGQGLVQTELYRGGRLVDQTAGFEEFLCSLFFGKESAGLPDEFLRAHVDQSVRVPMRAESRSLNLSNSVAILVYEVLRQSDFPGLRAHGTLANS